VGEEDFVRDCGGEGFEGIMTAVGGDWRFGRGGGGGAGLCCWGESFDGGEASLSESPSSIVSIARFLGFVGERDRSVGERGDGSRGVIAMGDFGEIDAL
jgi:hypothetical protein